MIGERVVASCIGACALRRKCRGIEGEMRQPGAVGLTNVAHKRLARAAKWCGRPTSKLCFLCKAKDSATFTVRVAMEASTTTAVREAPEHKKPRSAAHAAARSRNKRAEVRHKHLADSRRHRPGSEEGTQEHGLPHAGDMAPRKGERRGGLSQNGYG